MPYLPQFLKKKLTTMPEPALRRLAHITRRIALFSFASLPFLMGCIFYMVRPDISEALLRVFFATMLVGAMLLVFAELLKITKSSRQEELIDIILLSMMTFFFSILCVGIVSTVFFL
ncbi:hypothetical protein [uncultured Desulfovibrio sp.]|uniref:hypothetical protein n=1 Tax=uncultured Desulfovibrio sp. TaxID=167968 RepID=UPI002605611B|nr:hypothetical protein [uncultured Desulfovibrio sp.]